MRAIALAGTTTKGANGTPRWSRHRRGPDLSPTPAVPWQDRSGGSALVGQGAEPVSQAQVLPVVDRDLHEGRSVDLERLAQDRREIRRGSRAEGRHPERAREGHEVGVAE